MFSNEGVDFLIYTRHIELQKIEVIIGYMQHPETGIPFKYFSSKLIYYRSQKLFLTTIPAAISGSDLINWLGNYFELRDFNEANHLANVFVYYGYIYSIGDHKSMHVKDDHNALYRFQAPYFWVSKISKPDVIDYAIYLVKRTMRSRQKFGLEEYEQSALDRLQKMLRDKFVVFLERVFRWEFVYVQAEEQVRLGKERKRGDRIVIDAQERAFWRVHRPPPSRKFRLEDNLPKTFDRSKPKNSGKFKNIPIKIKAFSDKKTLENLVSSTMENSTFDWFSEPSDIVNPWCITDSTGSGAVSLSAAESVWPKAYCPFRISYDAIEKLSRFDEDCDSKSWYRNVLTLDSHNLPKTITVKQIRIWSANFDHLIRDPIGRYNFYKFLEKEFSGENLAFYVAVNELKYGARSQLKKRCKEIFDEFLGKNAASEINIDRKTMNITEKNCKEPNEFAFDEAQDHIHALMRNDSYVRFLRSDEYQALLKQAIDSSITKNGRHNQQSSQNAQSQQATTSQQQISQPLT